MAEKKQRKRTLHHLYFVQLFTVLKLNVRYQLRERAQNECVSAHKFRIIEVSVQIIETTMINEPFDIYSFSLNE